MDSRQWNICNLDTEISPGSEDPGAGCDTPAVNWSPVAVFAVQQLNTALAATTRMMLLGSLRFKYRYNLYAPAASSIQSDPNVRVASGLIVSPTDGSGAPLADQTTGSLPFLFSGVNANGDLPYPNIRILWRGLDLLSGWYPSSSDNLNQYQVNCIDRYIPTERVRGIIRLRENEGLFFVSESFAANGSTPYAFKTNVTGSFRIRSL